MKKGLMALMLAVIMTISLMSVTALAAECTYGQHDQLMELGTKCPFCGEWGKTSDDDADDDTSDDAGDDNKCTYGQHDQLMELGTKCPICGEWGKTSDDDADNDTSDDAGDDNKCTFGQHDQLMELGTKCPICGEWGKTSDDDADDDTSDDVGDVEEPECTHKEHGTYNKKDVVEATCTEDGRIIDMKLCNNCDAKIAFNTYILNATGHNWENGVCTVCGEKAPKDPVEPSVPTVPSLPIGGGFVGTVDSTTQGVVDVPKTDDSRADMMRNMLVACAVLLCVGVVSVVVYVKSDKKSGKHYC